MGALAVTNSFVAGTNIVASQMNANFTDVVAWATQTPTLSTSGSATTVSGTLSVTEAATFDALATFKNYIKLTHDLGANAAIYWEGATDNDFETYLTATDPTVNYGGLGWGENGRFLLLQRYQIDTPSVPASLWLLDVETGDISLLQPTGFLPIFATN